MDKRRDITHFVLVRLLFAVFMKFLVLSWRWREPALKLHATEEMSMVIEARTLSVCL